MTIEKQKRIIRKIVELEQDIDVLKKARMEAVANGYASATISSGGGSKSYTRYSPDQFTSMINELLKELAQWRGLLTTGNARPFKTIVTVYF